MTQQSKISAALIKAGIRNPDAWAVAGVPYPDAGPEGDAEAPEPSNPPTNGNRGIQPPQPQCDPRLAPALVLMKGPEDAPFLISWRSQRELGGPYVWESAVAICGGAVLTLAGLYMLLLAMHLL
jgi:hypothetical protein